MLYESGMAPSFWGEALATFVHVHNRISTSALPDTTPHESFLGNKPDVSMLRIWGCTAYVLVQKDKQPLGSLGSHMEKCIFIGYPDGYKAWKFYCPESKKVIISERADFDERFSSIRGILHPRFHPLVLNLSWNPPLSLFIFQTSLMTLQSIPVTHSCLFMGGTVLVLLNNHLLAP